VIGHTTARAYLERELPSASLLFGPPSIGKWTMALHLADHHRVHTLDRWLVEHGMTIDTVRLITHFAARSPQGAFKLIIARIDDASRPAINAILKTLEEPPPRVRFLLTASSRPAATVLSRCMPFELGALSQQELLDVYAEQGYPLPRARKAAAYARGSVKQGYGFENADAHRAHVLAMIKTVLTGDRDGFANAFATWDTHHSELLNTLLTECLTRRWTTFAEPETGGLHHDRRRLWQMVAALMKVRRARPRLGVRAALEPFLTRR
jgi:DNA polymerase III delta subunit-like protein